MPKIKPEPLINISRLLGRKEEVKSSNPADDNANYYPCDCEEDEYCIWCSEDDE